MAYTWIRQRTTIVSSGGRADMNLAQIPLGKTLRRTLFGWSCFVQMPMWQYELAIGDPVFAGLVLVRSGYAGIIPHPDVSPLLELNYPNERWLFWEAAQLTCDGGQRWKHPGTHVTLYTTGTLTTRECETATVSNFAGQTMDVHVSIESLAMLGLGLELTCTAYVGALYSP